jgi:hypothetical protein
MSEERMSKAALVALVRTRDELEAEREGRNRLQGEFNSVWGSRAGLVGSNNQLRGKMAELRPYT